MRPPSCTFSGIVLRAAGGDGAAGAAGVTGCSLARCSATVLQLWDKEPNAASLVPVLPFPLASLYEVVPSSLEEGFTLAISSDAPELSRSLATTARTGFLGVLGHEDRRFGFRGGDVEVALAASCVEGATSEHVPLPDGVVKILLSFGVFTGCRGVLLLRDVSLAVFSLRKARSKGEPCGVGIEESHELSAALPCMAAGGSITGPLGFSGLSTSAERRISIVSGSKMVGDLS